MIMTMFYVYKITNTENGKFYIGKTSNLQERWKNHKSKAKSGRTYFYKAICKYGEDAWDIGVIDSHENEDVAFALEKYWIEKLDSKNPKIGYNLAEGGKGGFCGKIPDEESRKKMSEVSKLRPRKPHTEEVKQKLKEARAKQNRQFLDIDLKNQILGMYRTNNYTKQQVADRFEVNVNTVKSVIRDGSGKDKFEPYKVSEKQKEAISKAGLGRVVSDCTREKLRKAHSGKKTGPMSEEHRAKISRSLNEKYEVSDELKTRIIEDFENLIPRKTIAEKNGVSVDCVDKVTKGMMRVSPLTGRRLSQEHKEKLSKAVIVRVHSDETKRMISVANSGESNGMYRKTHSNETRVKMSQSQSKRERKPISEEQKKSLSLKLKGQPRPPRILDSIKESVRSDYETGNFTKNQLAERYGLKYGSIVNILRKASE